MFSCRTVGSQSIATAHSNHNGVEKQYFLGTLFLKFSCFIYFSFSCYFYTVIFLCCRAFRGFRDHFPEQAENLLQSLEPTYRRALQGELCLSSSSSSGSIAQTAGYKTTRPYKPAVTPQSATGILFIGMQRHCNVELDWSFLNCSFSICASVERDRQYRESVHTTKGSISAAKLQAAEWYTCA